MKKKKCKGCRFLSKDGKYCVDEKGARLLDEVLMCGLVDFLEVREGEHAESIEE